MLTLYHNAISTCSQKVRLTLAEVRRTLAPDGFSKIQMAALWGARSLMMHLKKIVRKPHPFLVKYWTQRRLRRAFTALIGPTTVSVDGFFSLGPQASDLDLLPWRYRCVIHASELLRTASDRAGWIGRFADSVYLQSEPEKRGARNQK